MIHFSGRDPPLEGHMLLMQYPCRTVITKRATMGQEKK